tara:strand:+ start:774 stop:926 length:153 start_codon:yes stop_codon:yes gene_type:complete
MSLKQWLTYFFMKRDYNKLSPEYKEVMQYLKRTPQDYKKQFNPELTEQQR